MTVRHTVDSITSDALDALYEQLNAAEAGETQRQLATAREALASATTRAAHAEAAIARVRAVAGWAIQGWSDLSPEKVLLAVEGHEPAPAPAATQATDPSEGAPAITTGLVVQPYRDDHNRPRWVFRCWGTDTCDGWLSLDHHSQQSARRARDRHVAESHPEEQP
ncbi:hypothetical protein ACFW5V_28705 [Streptomyces sp. NPDC058762]|uniref:hypothetical protein n=1 Tax=Streptomyces sp. NPDC058762 TaxID=3346629 RepID=UPI0036ACF095